MKTTYFISIMIMAFTSCQNPKKQTNGSEEITARFPNLESQSKGEEPTGNQDDEYTVEDGRIYNPYDFPLEIEPLKALLGHDIAIDTKYFEDEYFPDGYTFIKITHKDTEIAFYDVLEAKYRARITTAKLSVLGGIKIGIKKQDFIKAMRFRVANAEKFNIFNLVDDYGAMTFSFQKDTLYLIDGYYEEGD